MKLFEEEKINNSESKSPDTQQSEESLFSQASQIVGDSEINSTGNEIKNTEIIIQKNHSPEEDKAVLSQELIPLDKTNKPLITNPPVYDKKLMFHFFNKTNKTKELKSENIREIYQITNIKNLETILDSGLLSHRRVKKRKISHIDIGDNEIIKLRGKKILKRVDETKPSRNINRHVNLYLNPHNSMMYRIRYEDKVPSENLCILCVHGDLLKRKDIVITDRNAATKKVNFYTSDAFILNSESAPAIYGESAKGLTYEETIKLINKCIGSYKSENQEDLLKIKTKEGKKILDELWLSEKSYPNKDKREQLYKELNKKLADCKVINDEEQELISNLMDNFKKYRDSEIKDKMHIRQAEVSAPYQVDASYIIGIFVNSEESKKNVQLILDKFKDKDFNLDIKVNADLFLTNGQYSKLKDYFPIRDDNKVYNFNSDLPDSSDSDEDYIGGSEKELIRGPVN
jgi:hypothetical protein